MFRLLALLGLILASSAPALGAQDLDDDVKRFKKIIRGKEGEVEARALIDRFVGLYKQDAQRQTDIEESLELDEGDARELRSELRDIEKRQKEIVETVAYSFNRSRVTQEHMQLWTAAILAFGDMGHLGAESLWKVFKDKRFDKDLNFRSEVVRQVGHTRDYTQAEALADLLDYHEEVIAAAAAEAIAMFERAPPKVRQELVSTLVVLLESRHNAATDISNSTAKRIYSTVREPFIRALSALTGQSFRDPLEWTHWWNNNKKNAEAWPEYD